MSMHWIDHPHVIFDLITGEKETHPSFAAANLRSAQMGGISKRRAVYDLRRPHIAIDSKGDGDMTFDDADEATRYVGTANAHHGYDRYRYQMVG